MSRILVTGGAGFIGSHLVNRFISLKHRVAIIDNFSHPRKNSIDRRAAVYRGHIEDSDFVNQVFVKEKPDYVSHHAAQISVNESLINPQKDADVNILGTLSILESCRRHKIRKVVFASSGGAIYGETRRPATENTPPNSRSPYGISKLAAEEYVKLYYANYGLPYIILRYSNVYGPGQADTNDSGVISIFMRAFRENNDCVVYGSGSQARDFVYIDDVVDINEKTLFSSQVGMYNVATGKRTSVNELYGMLNKLFAGNTVSKNIKPARTGEILVSVLSPRVAKKIFFWKPKTSIKRGLKLMSLMHLEAR